MDGTNYRDWAISIEMMFDSLDNLARIDGSTVFDEKPITNWVVVYRRTWGIFFQFVTIDVRVEMHSSWTAQEMWDYFRGRY